MRKQLRFAPFHNKRPNVLGMMSGTSLDGLDLALCNFNREDGQWKYTIRCAETIPYPVEWENRLRRAPDLSGLELALLDRELGAFYGQAARKFLFQHNLEADFIGSHGHTLFHIPEKKVSYQLGNGASLAAESKLDVLCDFRTSDVMRGGQGAPLVPIGDELLFPEYEACLNLGGIANVSYHTKEGRRGFDLSPCNMLLNYAAGREGLKYDDRGKLAKSGTVDNRLLQELNQWQWLEYDYPKSLGREQIEAELIPSIDRYEGTTRDLLATLVAFVVRALVRGMHELKSDARILVSGGGAHNSHLIESLSLESGRALTIPPNQTIDFREALIFAFLALLATQNEVNVLSSVTGSSGDHIGGVWYRY